MTLANHSTVSNLCNNTLQHSAQSTSATLKGDAEENRTNLQKELNQVLNQSFNFHATTTAMHICYDLSWCQSSGCQPITSSDDNARNPSNEVDITHLLLNFLQNN